MNTPFLDNEKVQVNATSILWLGLTTLLALVITLVGAWGMSTSSRVDKVEVKVDSIAMAQAVELERYQEIERQLAKMELKIDQIILLGTPDKPIHK
jgi:hypothetical protein